MSAEGLQAPVTSQAAAIRPVTLRVFAFTFCLYALYFALSFRIPTSQWFYITGDEPHYLIMTLSLLRDGDLAVDDEYADGSYRVFYPADLDDPPAAGIRFHTLRAQDGSLYSKHGPGLALLVLPAYALGGHVGVNLFMLLLSSVLSAQAFAFAYDLTGAMRPSLAAWGLSAFAPPLLLYSPLVFPEMAGGLCLLYAVRQATAIGPRRSQSLLAALCLALLPWFHVRYIVFLLPMVVFLLADRHPSRMLLMGGAAVGVVTLGLNYCLLYGGMPAPETWGTFSPWFVPKAALGLLLDREFGLLPFAPIYVLGVAGLVWGCARDKDHRGAWALVASTLAMYYVMVGSYSAWHGQWNPPGRMLVSVVPLLVPALALSLRRATNLLSRSAALALGLWGCLAGLVFALSPELRFDFPTGRSEFWSYVDTATGGHMQGLIPSLVVASPRDYLLATLWLAVFGVSSWLWFRRTRRGA
jgi:hypothetical protein